MTYEIHSCFFMAFNTIEGFLRNGIHDKQHHIPYIFIHNMNNLLLLLGLLIFGGKLDNKSNYVIYIILIEKKKFILHKNRDSQTSLHLMRKQDAFKGSFTDFF